MFENIKHTAEEGLQQVHGIMINRYKMKDDVTKAKQMQEYLQYFKKIFMNPSLASGANSELLKGLGLNEIIIEQMRQRFQEVLGVTKNYTKIFQSKHSFYSNRKNFDDIVEGELNALLQVVAEQATGKKNIALGQKIVGGDSAIVDLSKMSKELVDGISQKIEDEVRIEINTSELYEGTKIGKSGKQDVKGYNKELIISTNIENNNRFNHFIQLFTGVSFSIKNYQGGTKWQIHLGNSNPLKAMYGTLRYLGYEQEDAVHIYSHARASYLKNNNNLERNADIFHLRFAYELTGNGLIDAESGNPLKAVDFFIYNDPTSETQIYVKSTKEMINEVLNSQKKTGRYGGVENINDPWASIYISKTSFN